MSTKYNSYAQRLDIAFKAARDEYAAAYNAVEQARKAMQDAGQDALKRQIATLQLQETERKCDRKRSAFGRSLTQRPQTSAAHWKRKYRQAHLLIPPPLTAAPWS